MLSGFLGFLRDMLAPSQMPARGAISPASVVGPPVRPTQARIPIAPDLTRVPIRVPAVEPTAMARYWKDSLNFIDFKALSSVEKRQIALRKVLPLDAIAGKSALSLEESEDAAREGIDVNVIISLWAVDKYGEKLSSGRRHLLLAVPAMLVKEDYFAPRLDAAPVFNNRYLGPAIGSGAFTLAESGDAEKTLTDALLTLTEDPAKIPGWKDWFTGCAGVLNNLTGTQNWSDLLNVLAERATEILPSDRKRDISWKLYAAVYDADGAGTKNISELYDSVIEAGPSECPELALYRTLCGGERAKPVADLPLALEEALLGHIDEYVGDRRSLFPLDETQRLAVRAILSLEDGEVQAVNGPPGSGKTSMLRAVVASLWARAALFNEPCPIIVACGATNQSVTNVIGAFGNAPHPDDSYKIAQRWVPDATSYGAYFPAAHILKGDEGAEVKAKNVVIQQSRGAARGFPYYYDGRPDALDPLRALDYEQFYLDQARSAFPNDKIDSVEDVVKILFEELSALYELQRKLLRCEYPPDEIESYCRSDFPFFSMIWTKRRYEAVDQYVDRLIVAPSDREAAQEFLDLTWRSEAFHLAARYWEGRFLLAQRVRLLNRHPENVEEALRRICMLTPCIVSTLHVVPKLAALDSRVMPPEDSRTHAFGLFDLLVVDEAGQAVPELAGSAFSLARRAAVVGDLKQLAPIWSISALGEIAVAGRIGAEDALEHIVQTRRSAATGSALGMARLVSKWSEVGEDGVTLRYHYRCKPSIIDYCNGLSYGGTLQPRTSEDDGFSLPALGWVEVDSLPKPIGGSFRNEAEANEIIGWIVEQWPRWQHDDALWDKPLHQIVAILTAYRPQADYLERELRAEFSAARRQKPDDWPTDEDVRKVTIGTVHRLQGAERPIVCFSLVEGPDQTADSFMDRDETLMNVAVSRAKKSFLIFANPARLFGPAHQDGGRLSPTRLLGRHLRVRREAELLYPKRLVLIEANGKLGALSAILGRTSRVIATGGALHKTDRNKETDIAAGFNPPLMLESQTQGVLDAIKAVVPSISEIVLATDDDRMGEYIAWQARRLLGVALDGKTVGRARMGAITETAVLAAMSKITQFHEPSILAEAVRETVDHIVTKRFSAVAKFAKHRRAAEAEVDRLRPIGAVTQDPMKSPGRVGRVQAAILRLLLERAREVAANADQRRIEAVVELEDGQFVGTVFHVAEDRDATDVSKSQAAVEMLDGATIRLIGPPLIIREHATAPSAGTAAVLAGSWACHRLLPWDAMDSLQRLYDGSWTRASGRHLDPEDPIEPSSTDGGHPPITPLDRTAPPKVMKASMQPNDHAAYSVLWDFHLAAELGGFTSVYAKLECELADRGTTALRVRFEGMSAREVPDDLQYVVATDRTGEPLPDATGLLDIWRELDGCIPTFRIVPTAIWDVEVDALLLEMERSRVGRPSTYTRALKKLEEGGLIAFPVAEGPIRLTPTGVATALSLESDEPELSSPAFSADLGDLTAQIVAEKIGPREAFLQMLPILAPSEDPDVIGPRIWNSLADLEAVLAETARPLPGALVGSIHGEGVPNGADAGR